MSFHNKPEYNTPAIVEGLQKHGLEHDTPSQLSDAFRLGFVYADRAQRAAPGVQGGEATDQQLSAAMAEGNQLGIKSTDALRILAAYRNAAQPPQQSAQPVAWMHETPGRVDVIHDEVKKLLSAAATDYLHRPIDKSEKYTIPLYAAAQPVEVQRVGLQPAQVEAIHDALMQHTRTADIWTFASAIEAAHGIKPTSSEGGA